MLAGSEEKIGKNIALDAITQQKDRACCIHYAENYEPHHTIILNMLLRK